MWDKVQIALDLQSASSRLCTLGHLKIWIADALGPNMKPKLNVRGASTLAPDFVLESLAKRSRTAGMDALSFREGRAGTLRPGC